MERQLRLLEPGVPVRKRKPSMKGDVIVVVTVLSLLYQFFMGSNVIHVIFGSDPNIRFSPANILMLCLAVYVLANGPVSFHRRCRQSPMLVLYFFAVPLFMFYTAFFNGFSGAAFYFDSFWAPAFVAIALESVSERQQRFIGKLLLALVMLNVVFGLMESVTHTNVFPFVNEDALTAKEIAAELQVTDDFRANAFYTHPLTASLVTAMGLFMALAMRLRFTVMAPSFLLIFVALLAFGGRTALVVAGLVICLISAWIVLSGILHRTLRLSTISYMVLAAIVLPLMIAYIITQTSIADRIVDTFYLDDSAEVRVIQWHVLRYLSLKNWLFGVSMDELNVIKFQVGITGVEDIENFWLLVFLNLGVIGFTAFVAIFGMFLVHVANYAGGLYGWALMLSGLVIDSGSNSLGTKSNDLVIEVAMLMAIAGYRRYKGAERLPVVPRMGATARRSDRSGLLSGPVTAYRGLSVRPVLQSEWRM